VCTRDCLLRLIFFCLFKPDTKTPKRAASHEVRVWLSIFLSWKSSLQSRQMKALVTRRIAMVIRCLVGPQNTCEGDSHTLLWLPHKGAATLFCSTPLGWCPLRLMGFGVLSLNVPGQKKLNLCTMHNSFPSAYTHKQAGLTFYFLFIRQGPRHKA
jgi:hypothetical protein